MDISISVRLMDKYISIMAIPFHVPEGVGPAIDANNNNSQRNIHTTTQEQRNNFNNNSRVTVPNSDTPAATGIHQVELRDSTRINLQTFPRQLFAELSALYNSICVVPPQPTIATSPISPFDMSSINNQDNQGSSSGGAGMTTRADQVVTRSQLPLPDIIQCHAGLSLEASYHGCRVRRRRSSQVSNDRRRRLSPRRPSSNNNEQADHIQENGPHHDGNGGGEDDDEDEEELNSEWTLELKLLVGPWRQAGIELRAIADRYQLENSRRRERENLERRRHLQLRLIVNMAIPAAAILAWGVSWLRRH